MAVGPLKASEMEAISRGWRSNPKRARAALLKHLDRGGLLDPDDWALLFCTYLKWKGDGPVGLDAKIDARRDALVDQMLETVRGPKSKKFLALLGNLTSSKRTSFVVLSDLARLLMALERLREACEVFEIYRNGMGGMSVPVLAQYLHAAEALGEPDVTVRAVKAFDDEKRAGDQNLKPLEREYQKLRTKAGGRGVRPVKPKTPEALTLELVKALSGNRKGMKSKALKPGKLAKLRAPDGGALPPSLRVWLGFDAKTVPLFAKNGRWDSIELGDWLRRHLEDLGLDEELMDPRLVDLPKPLTLSTQVIELEGSANQEHLFAFTKRDKHGECPVYGFQVNELWVKYPTFADFLQATVPMQSSRR